VLRFAAEMTGPQSPFGIILYDGQASSAWQPPRAADELSFEHKREILEWSKAASTLADEPLWRGVYAEALSRVARSLGCIVPTTR
jgi:hypothetical protein